MFHETAKLPGGSFRQSDEKNKDIIVELALRWWFINFHEIVNFIVKVWSCIVRRRLLGEERDKIRISKKQDYLSRDFLTYNKILISLISSNFILTTIAICKRSKNNPENLHYERKKFMDLCVARKKLNLEIRYSFLEMSIRYILFFFNYCCQVCARDL